MAVLGAIKSAFSGAGRWILIGLLVVAAIAIPGFGWARARKKLKEERAKREAAERRAEIEADRARVEAEAAEDQRRINERLAAERHRLAEEKKRIEDERRDESERIERLDGDKLASAWRDHFDGDSEGGP